MKSETQVKDNSVLRVQCEKHCAVIYFLAAGLRLKGGKMHIFKTHPELPPPQLY